MEAASFGFGTGASPDSVDLPYARFALSLLALLGLHATTRGQSPRYRHQ